MMCVLVRSSFETASLNWRAPVTSWLFSDRITSPGRIPARAAAPSAASTSTPPLMRSCPRRSSGMSATPSPGALLCCALPPGVGCGRLPPPLRACCSGCISATVTASSRVAPLRQTVTGTFVPGLVLPTIRGRSVERWMSLPSYLRMMSPTSIPPRSAGPPGSTLRTSAPAARGRPSGSATSLVTSAMPTPIRPRVTRPEVRICSATRIASSIGIANEMPMKPPVRL